MCMCLGFAKLSYAQNLVVTASQTNATTNDIITFYATFYDQNSGCVDEGSVTWNFGTNAVIIDGAGSGMVQVRYTSAGTRRVSANVNVNCNGGRPSRLGSTVTVNITQAPITISGRVANPCGIGIGGVSLQGFPTSVVTDANGYYTTTVPYGWSGSVSAVKSPIQFTPSQPVVNTNTDRTLNFSVVGGALEFASLTATWGYNPAVGDVVTIGGLVPGYSYTYSYFHKPNGQWIEVELTPDASTYLVQINKNDNYPFCVRRKCGNVTQVCAY